MKINYLIILVFFIVLLLTANITLLALSKISEILFWIAIAAAAVFAYWVLPKMKKREA